MSTPPLTSTSRPQSGYEDLSLDDDTSTDTRRQPSTNNSSSSPSNSTSRYSATPSVSRSSIAPSLSALDTRPKLKSFASSSSAGSSGGGGSFGGGGGGGGINGIGTSSTGKLAGDGRKVQQRPVPLVLGVAVVDFNHLVGPTVEFAHPLSLHSALSDDESLNRLLPFLALPDGAHLSEEDYSYFHCTYETSHSPPDTNVPPNQTLFGISCNRQLASADLIKRPSDVTRSTVQKAVVVIASKPVFGPIRDRLGVVTRAYFAQRDFTQTEILEDFYASLEPSLEEKSDEGAIYMGTSLRELVHKFRHRTLVLLKLLMLQKRIMLFGYPVEMLCTYQYSLVSLMPGLLLNLRDSGAPHLDFKTTRTRPTSLRSSDRGSLLRYMGLPLHVFGQDSFFQPYLPLQQVEMLAAKSWLTGTTNQIVTQQKDCKYDLLVNIENVGFEFTDPKLERIVALTPADRRWMDDVVRTVEETWDVDEGERPHFKGSDDDLRSRFEEYICAALSSIKYADFVAKGQAQDLTVVGTGGEETVLQSFSEPWLAAFRTTDAFEVWNACTDPALFDICEPKHPCNGKATIVSDLGLRITEGLHDLHIDQQLGPTREVLSSAFTAGSTAFAAGSSSLFKAFDGVRNDISARIEAERARREKERANAPPPPPPPQSASQPTTLIKSPGTPVSPISPATHSPVGTPTDIRATLGGIGSGIGSFFGSRVASFRGGGGAGVGGGAVQQQQGVKETKSGLRPMSLKTSGSGSSLKKQNGGEER